MLETSRKLVAAGVAIAALGATLGCNQRAGAANRDTNNDGVVDTVATTATYDNERRDDKWTDARILRAVVTANTLDSTLGAFAVKAAHSPGVKDFARTMMRDHGATNGKARALGAKASIAYDSSHIEKGDPKADMVEDASDKLNDLRKLQGIEFDKGYMQTEVKMHEDVLNQIDKDLIPNAVNVELRGFLEAIRPTIASHLERAKMLKEELDRGAVPTGGR